MLGRPTKLTTNFLRTAKKVLDNAEELVLLTDEDLLFEINDKLPEDERISKRTFERWKAKCDDEEDESLNKKEATFVGYIKKALRLQERKLLENLMNDDGRTWKKWAWLLERKFIQWNLKKREELGLTAEDFNPFLYGDWGDDDDEV